MKQIKNGRIVLKDRVLENYSLLIDCDEIKGIVETSCVDPSKITTVIDAQGGYVTPGFIDVHADYIEQMVAPRVTSMMDQKLAMYEFEKELVTHGITTMFHSVSLLKDSGKKALRRPENIRKLVQLIDQSHSELHLIHHRFHLRFELDNLEQYDELIRYLENDQVHLLSFMDHTPGQGQYRNLEIYKLSYLNDEGYNEAQVNNQLEERLRSEKITLDKIKYAAEIALKKGIAIASHDDDTIEKLDVTESFHASISEFPITMEVAKEAKRRGLMTVMGAPNILLGKSHAGNLSARDALKENVVDVLCSDYYPASLLHAVFQLVHQGEPIEDIIRLVTYNPAKAVHLEDKIGSIEVGKKADLLILLELPNGLPAITHVLVNGMLVSQTNYRVY